MYIYLYGMTRGQDGTSLNTTYCVYKGNTFWLYAFLPLSFEMSPLYHEDVWL